MATREVTGTTPFGIGRTAVAGVIAMLAGLVAAIIVAGMIVLGSPSAAGSYTLGRSDDWGTRHGPAVPAAAPVELGPQDDYGLRHPISR